jgi:hypothetical protein
LFTNISRFTPGVPPAMSTGYENEPPAGVGCEVAARCSAEPSIKAAVIVTATTNERIM